MITADFSAAADSLDIQVARVSRSVSKIERQLGVSILNRTTRRLELTEEGQQFIHSVRQGLLQLQQAEEDLVSRGELPKGRLRVDAASPFIFHQLIPLIKGFSEVYPDIKLELTSNEGIVDLLEKKTDVAIRIGRLVDSTLHARALGSSLLHIVAAPSYLSAQGIPHTTSQLADHQLLGLSGAKILNQWPLKGFNSIQPNIISSNGESVRQLAIAGNGIACLSAFMVKKDIESGLLIPLLADQKQVSHDREQINAVYYKSSAIARRISAFIDYIQPRLSL
ncbi:MAG: LysR substrate-binding domain-containing protein [Psychromonas sp.]